MGANTTQAQGVALFLLAFTAIAAGFAADMSLLWILIGVVLLGASVMVFQKCKPWEHRED